MASAKLKKLVGFLVVAIVVGVAAFLIHRATESSPTNPRAPHAVAKGGVHLSAGEFKPEMAQHCPVMFKASFCGWCKKLLGEMGDAFFLVVETSEDATAAQSMGVGGIPDVRFQAEKAVGYGDEAKALLRKGTQDGCAAALALI